MILLVYLLFFNVVFSKGINKRFLLRRQLPGGRESCHCFAFYFRWRVMKLTHSLNGFVSTCYRHFTPKISRPVTQPLPRTRQSQEIPLARLYASAQGPFAALHFLLALLTSYNRHRLSFCAPTIGISNHGMRQILKEL